MEAQNWFDLDGDNTLALDWDLNKNSRVWEIGGFEGRWAQQIWDKFHCHIDIFEPQIWAYKKLRIRFEGIEKIKIYPYGLMPEDGTHNMGNFYNDGASLFDYGHGESEIADFRMVSKVFYELNVQNIDLALMNIEGAEFELIPFLIVNDHMKKFRQFWCQFHMGLPSISEPYNRKDWIFTEMEKTHDMLWNCFPFAVAWRLRE